MADNKVVLGYWAIRGRAQAVRFLLEYLKVSYEDKLYTDPNEWFGKDKPDIIANGTIFANLPYLKDGNFYLAESRAILEYVATKFNGKDLLGKDAAAVGRINELLGVLEDVNSAVSPILFNPDFENLKGPVWEKNKARFELIVKKLGDNNFVAADYFTVADIRFYEFLHYVKGIYRAEFDKYPTLQAFIDRFEQLPGIKEYISSDRFAGFKNKFLPPSAKWTGF